MTPEAPAFVRVLAVSREIASTVEALAATAQLALSVHICSASLEDAVANARAATPEGGILAVVEGKNALVSALAAGVDEAVDVHTLTPELLSLAAQLTAERYSRRRDQDNYQRQLAHTAKLVALATVVAGVAHEVNNPATMITLQLGQLTTMMRGVRTALADLEAGAVDRAASGLRAALGEDRAELALRDCNTGLQMITEVVRDLRGLSQVADAGPPEIVDVRKLLEQVLRLSGVGADAAIHIERDYPDEVPQLWLPRSRVLQIFANLVTNAAYAMRAAPGPLRRLRILIRLDETTMMITLSDTGAGIAQERLGRLFEPFFTTKGPEHGTGLGLYMSREIVRKLGGELTLDSVEGQGTAAMLFLPLALQSKAAPDLPEPPRKPRILVAHDEPDQLVALRRAIPQRYEVALAHGAIEALDLLTSGSRVDMVICGRDEPSVAGESLRERLATQWSHLAPETILLEDLCGPEREFDRDRVRAAFDRRRSAEADRSPAE